MLRDNKNIHERLKNIYYIRFTPHISCRRRPNIKPPKSLCLSSSFIYLVLLLIHSKIDMNELWITIGVVKQCQLGPISCIISFIAKSIWMNFGSLLEAPNNDYRGPNCNHDLEIILSTLLEHWPNFMASIHVLLILIKWWQFFLSKLIVPFNKHVFNGNDNFHPLQSSSL